jgi:hypothetical protein
MKQSCSSEANRPSASRQLSPLFWNLKIHCRGCSSQSQDYILIQMNAVHTVSLDSSTPSFSHLSLPFKTFNYDYVSTFCLILVANIRIILLNLITPMTFDEQYKLRGFSLYNFSVGPNILLSTISSNTLHS